MYICILDILCIMLEGSWSHLNLCFSRKSSYLGFACRTLPTFVSCSSNNNLIFRASTFYSDWLCTSGSTGAPAQFLHVLPDVLQCEVQETLGFDCCHFVGSVSLLSRVCDRSPAMLLLLWQIGLPLIQVRIGGWVPDWPCWYSYCGRYVCCCSGYGKGILLCWSAVDWVLTYLGVLC